MVGEEFQNNLTIPVKKNHRSEIENLIKDYKNDAKKLTKLLTDTENKRTRIMNHIEEMVYNKKLDARTAHRLEDKLTRPYAISLFRIT